MIDIKKLSKNDIGKWVIYTASHGKEDIGKIKAWSDKHIFVVFNCASEWSNFENYTGQATKPEDLIFMK